MICYRDMSFCSDSEVCKNANGCSRNFTEEVRQAAIKWWGGEGAPVAFMAFRETCKEFRE